MTIGHVFECVASKLAALTGARIDATAFSHKPVDEICNMLKRAGYSEDGKEILYHPHTGKRMRGRVFIGPTYYQRLKHMVGLFSFECPLILQFCTNHFIFFFFRSRIRSMQGERFRLVLVFYSLVDLSFWRAFYFPFSLFSFFFLASHRAKGKIVGLTRQPVDGRANGGGKYIHLVNLFFFNVSLHS